MSDIPVSHIEWPQSRLGPIRRLHVLAAALPGTWVEERLITKPFADVWGFLSDLETSAPAFDTDVADLRIVERSQERLRLRVRLPKRFLALPFRVDAELRTGWCWMTTRPQFYVVGMAAEPEGDATRFAHLEGINIPGSPVLRALTAPIHAASRWRHRHHVPADVDHIEHIFGTRP